MKNIPLMMCAQAKAAPLAAILVALLASSATPAATFEYEVEHYSVGRETTGEPNVTTSDGAASGGKWVTFDPDGTGQWIMFTAPNVQPGTYTVKLRYKQHATRGRCQLSIGQADGTQQIDLGTELNQQGPDNVYTTVTLGTKSFGQMGFKTFRFRSTAANSGAYRLSFDKLILEEAFTATVPSPSGLVVTQTASSFCKLSWTDNSSTENGFLVERSVSPFTNWEVVGYAQANGTGFVATGLKDSTAYQFRIVAFNAAARSTPSPAASASTPGDSHVQQGAIIDTTGGRSGEGTMVSLSNGHLLMFYNFQSSGGDFGQFFIYKKTSTNNGVSWSAGTQHLGDASGAISYMMPSLLRLANGSIAFVYTVKDMSTLEAHRYFRYSTDEGSTWSTPVKITTDLPMAFAGYTLRAATGPHDRLIQTSSGRIIFPVHVGPGEEQADPDNDAIPDHLYATTFVYSSTDNGAHWSRNAGPLSMKGTREQSSRNQVLMEPSIVETSANHLLLYMRNQSGFYYQSTSTDDGATWSFVRQSPVMAPLTPAKLVRINASTIGMIFNPWVDRTQSLNGDRFVLGTMFSTDEGNTWQNFRPLEFRTPNSTLIGAPAYPYVLFAGGYLHIAYFGMTSFDMMYRREATNWFTN